MKNRVAFIIILFLCHFSFFSMAQTRHFPQPNKGLRLEGALVSENGETLKFTHSLDSAEIARKDSARIMVADSSVMKNRPKRMHDTSTLDTVLNSFYADSILCDSSKIAPVLESDTAIALPSQPIITSDSTLSSPNYQNWINREANLSNQYQPLNQRQNTFDNNKIKYNIDNRLKISQSSYKADPKQLEIEEQSKEGVSYVGEADINRRNWLHSFNGSLQFSQAYISPNWYQGGNNNLNMLLNTEFNIKLNEKFHPNLLFETSFKYKLGMNSAPEDTLRNYSISEDLFQLNSKFGVRAAKRWFYSIQLQFKTQVFNGYKINSNDLKASFLSPGELNVGLGMTYNYANEKKTFSFDASISPLSYNLKSCINSRMHETDFGIPAGKKTASDIGSSGEGKLKWQIAHNISLSSRLFVFTDYQYIQGDLENTLSFAINRFLSTQINVNMRYDSSSPRIPGSKWHKFQLKEILSFGFAYSFKNL